MPRRARQPRWGTSLQRTINALTRAGTRAIVKATRQALKAAAPPKVTTPRRPPRPSARPAGQRVTASASARCVLGTAATAHGSRRYRLDLPPPSASSSAAVTTPAPLPVPLLVLLHGCDQSAEAIARSSRLQAAAARAGWLLLCPEQDRLANPHGCWNWFELRSGRAQDEAAIVMTAIARVSAQHAVDPRRIAVAGLSAGASLASLLALRYPGRFGAVAMHSGVGPGIAQSTAGALRAMQGHLSTAAAMSAPAADHALPPLLVIQGAHDRVVAPVNGSVAARRWAAAMGAEEGSSRVVQRGARRAMTITEFKCARHVAVRLCEIDGLGHAWSGGAAGQRYSDPHGPDAARLIMAFVSQAFDARG